MKITFDRIKKITEDGRSQNLDIRVRDIAFHVLEKTFGDAEIAYRTIFDAMAGPDDVEFYKSGEVQKFIQLWMRQYNAQAISDSLTFAENKAALIDMLNEIDDQVAAKEIAYKDALKMKADIRIKLQDKFAVTDEDKGTIVVVPPKYNKICPHTQRECYEMTAEYAMQQFHLIPDPAYTNENEEK